MEWIRFKNIIFFSFITLSTLLFSCASDNAEEDTSKDVDIATAYWEDYTPDPAKWGWIDTHNHPVIPAKFDDARDFSEGLAAVNYKGRWGYVDTKGAMRIEPQFMEARSFHEQKAAVKDFEGHMGFISATGDTIVPMKFINLGDYRNGLAQVQTETGWGYVDVRGKQVLKPQFQRTWPFVTKNCARVKEGKAFALIDEQGRHLNKDKIDRIYAYSGGAFRFKKKGKYGLLDTSGKIVRPAIYDRITPSSQGKYLLIKGDEVSIFPGGHTFTRPADIRSLKYIGAGRIRFAKDTLMGLMDTTGSVVVSPSFVQINGFHDGLALCARPGGDLWNWIRPDGTLFWKVDFPLSWDFYEGKARIITSQGIGVIDKNGHTVIPPGYNELRDFKEGLARFQAYPE